MYFTIIIKNINTYIYINQLFTLNIIVITEFIKKK